MSKQPYPAVDSYATTVPASQPRKLFDITCVIGSVYEGDSDFTPRQVAFLMIADHTRDLKDPSTYHFPDEDGNDTSLTVTPALPDNR